jgi:hypothetical protein
MKARRVFESIATPVALAYAGYYVFWLTIWLLGRFGYAYSVLSPSEVFTIILLIFSSGLLAGVIALVVMRKKGGKNRWIFYGILALAALFGGMLVFTIEMNRPRAGEVFDYGSTMILFRRVPFWIIAVAFWIPLPVSIFIGKKELGRQPELTRLIFNVGQKMSVLASIQKILTWRLFSRREEVVDAVDIIKWWELRRIPYNIAVGTAGIITLVVVVVIAAIASWKFGEPLGLPDPPIIAVFAVLGYAIGANVCLTGGWMAEIIARKLWQERVGAFAQISFALGVVFSILLTLAPAALFTVLLVARLLWHFL